MPAASRPALEAPPYAAYLKGLTICLDPGHGGRSGRAGFKRGPTGLQEAEVNLRVARFLKEFLDAAGARVILTRSGDVYLHEDDAEDNRRRAGVANAARSDVFLSIHHNASDTNPNANFSSVWYHGSVDSSPASLDVARHLSIALADELRLPQQLGCPILSDTLMYARSGFAVLRAARVPAVLVEASFHSNPAQEQRLRDPAYGRARYAYGGVPRAKLIEPADGIVYAGGPHEVVIELDDGIRARKSWGWDQQLILRDSILVRRGTTVEPHVFDEAARRIIVSLPSRLQAGPLRLQVQFENLFKHSNTRPHVDLQVRPGVRPTESAVTAPPRPM